MGGYEWQHFHRSGSRDGWGLYGANCTSTDGEGAPLAGTPANRSFLTWKTENFLVSFFGRANYILMDRYLFTATVRYDGSSRFREH